MKKNNNQKTNNNDNKMRSWVMDFSFLTPRARGCSCFNCFYIVLNVFGSLKVLILKGLTGVNVRDLVPNVRYLVLGYLLKVRCFKKRTMC
jgi:hypothetical protein